MKNAGTMTSVAVWMTSQIAAAGPVRRRMRAIRSVYMNGYAGRRAWRTISEEHVEREGRSVRFRKVRGHEIAGHIDACAEPTGASAQHVADISHGQRTNLGLAVPVERANRVESGVEDALCD